MTKLTYAEKKAKERAKKRAEGYKEISVWIAPEHAEKLREFAAQLPAPRQAEDPNQMTFLDD